MADDKSLFEAEMAGVKKLNIAPRVERKTTSLSAEQKKIRRTIAVSEDSVDSNQLMTDHLEFVEPLSYLEFHRTGIQHGVLKSLRLGKYGIEAKLDLHHRTVEQARSDVYEFVRDCVRYDVRTVIISHGKGERSEPKALLKSHVNRWLRHLDEVMAFYTALPRHGGYGAVYVMLRKSPEKKLENKERHERRR
ncbi:DNA endonuclease SmrA [Umboniibacter marinipuniceus]|uniref:DNA-nicking Smr family endonuclease n=1 Tax=Umboniibacter marinipuniceus TaxID=569599 RepID=A0A3M0AA13_9GAMM|nr:DNA endonuclease SmrA [Umboniibacter marinipuniceus]RMA81134.1 DNA-nicking Smr family endonuclease [Umboniibacter marinipuniceus]